MLTAVEIGRLAKHIEAALKKFPDDDSLSDELQVMDELEEGWERELRRRVDRDTTLPEYASLPVELVEVLANHLGTPEGSGK